MPRHNGATLTKLVQFRLHNYGVEFWGTLNIFGTCVFFSLCFARKNVYKFMVGDGKQMNQIPKAFDCTMSGE